MVTMATAAMLEMVYAAKAPVHGGNLIRKDLTVSEKIEVKEFFIFLSFLVLCCILAYT
jgi:hypothetical protein